MFRNRYFIVGVGVGIIVGVLLLQMILVGQQLTPELTREQLEQAAERQGLRLIPIDGATNKPKQTTTDVSGAVDKKAADESQSSTEADSDKQLEETASVEVSSAAVHVEDALLKEDTDSKSNGAIEAEPQFVDIRIKPNLSSIAIAEQLEQAGVISDSDDFVSYIKDEKKQTMLRAGYFKFEVPSTNEQALKVLTSHPNG
ncbi:hypothetical protein [Paenibacillus marinisediminis]